MTIVFITAKGEKISASAAEGDNLLTIGQSAGLPLEGTCEGQMACSTCHVILSAEWYDKLGPASPDEEDMLDLATGVQRTSRLSCQIEVTAEMDGMEVHLPAEFRNMQIG